MVFSDFMLYMGNLRAGRLLHASILKNVVASPMRFFDETPHGRIINRFGRDIDVVDSILPGIIWWCLFTLLQNIATPVVIGYSTPLFLTVIVPLILVYIVVQVIICSNYVSFLHSQMTRDISSNCVCLKVTF